MCNTNIHSNFYLHIHKLVLSNLYQCSYWSQNYSEIWFSLMTTPPLPMTSSWLFKMPKLEKKNPSQCQEGDFQNLEDIISSSKCYQHIRKFLKNDAPTLPRAFSWLMKNAQNLEKTLAWCQEGVFQNYGHTEVGFFASLWAPFWPSSIIICGFLKLAITPTTRLSSLLGSSLQVKGLFVAFIVGFGCGCLFGRQPMGFNYVGSMHPPSPTKQLVIKMARRICWGRLWWWPILTNQIIWFYDG